MIILGGGVAKHQIANAMLIVRNAFSGLLISDMLDSAMEPIFPST